jgi:acyl dehydratase
MAANRAAFAAFGVGSRNNGTEGNAIEGGQDLSGWDFTTTVEDRADIGVGDRIEFSKVISNDDIKRFATASGDTNPLHLDDDAAAKTRFGGRIAHGTLVGGLISAALARLPGLVVYLSQDLEFHAPVRVDERVTAECEIVEDLGNDQYRLTTQVLDDEDVVIDGEAVVLIDELPDDE